MIEAEMAESEVIQTVVKQVAIQAAMAAVMAIREEDAGHPSGTNMLNSGEAHRQRQDAPTLRQPSYNRKVQISMQNLLSFERKVINILQNKTYELNEEERVPVIKN